MNDKSVQLDDICINSMPDGKCVLYGFTELSRPEHHDICALDDLVH